MTGSSHYAPLAQLAGLDPDHPLVRAADAERALPRDRLGETLTEREAWLAELVVQRTVEREAARQQVEPR